MSLSCASCGVKVPGASSSTDWEQTMCDACWSLTSRVTRGWLLLTQRNGDAAGWPERYVTEHNLTWDVLVAQARFALAPPPKRKGYDPKRVLVDMSKVGKPRGGYARQLERERNRGKR